MMLSHHQNSQRERNREQRAEDIKICHDDFCICHEWDEDKSILMIQNTNDKMSPKSASVAFTEPLTSGPMTMEAKITWPTSRAISDNILSPETENSIPIWYTVYRADVNARFADNV